MRNSPFRFVDSPGSVERLRRALTEIGLSHLQSSDTGAADDEPNEPDPNHPVTMRFVCPWLNQPVELHWQFGWWPDGVESELDQVTVQYWGNDYGVVSVDEVRQRKIARPLAEVVTEAIVAACAELTGKRFVRR
jgi:hypothetical protein